MDESMEDASSSVEDEFGACDEDTTLEDEDVA
jgi:hypothetical protein